MAVLLRIVANPLGNVFQKQLIHGGNNPLVINFLTYLFLSVPCLFFALNINWSELPGEFWLYATLVGILGALGNGFLVKALEKGDLSVLGPINSYKSLIGIVGGIFLLGEIPNVWGLMGICLIIYGSYFVLDGTDDRFSWKLLKRKEIQFRFLALVLTAIEAVFAKRIILISSGTLACISWCWFGAIFSFLFLLVSGVNPRNESSRLKMKHFGKALLVVLCAGIMLLTTTYTFTHMPVGYALSLFQLSTIGSVLLGQRFFDEKGIRRKLIGSLIMIAGSVVIILLKDKS
jgi:drug/metabolite transporter (DMT)-like permease